MHMLGPALETKFLWRMVKKVGLWGKVMIENYIAPIIVED